MASSPNPQRQQLSLLGYWGWGDPLPCMGHEQPRPESAMDTGGPYILQVLQRKDIHTLLLSCSRNKARDN